VLALNPASYYPLDEPATAVGASNLAPVTVSATLTLSGNQGAAPVFGVVTPGIGVDPVSQVAVQFSGGQFLRASTPVTMLSGLGGGVSLMCVYSGVAAGPMALVQVGRPEEDAYEIGIDGTGKAYGRRYNSAVSVTSLSAVNDGKVHLLVFTYNGASAVMSVDGVGSASGVSSTLGSVATGFAVGGSAGLGLPASATVGQVAFFKYVLSNLGIATLFGALFDGFVGDATNDRVTRLAKYAGIASSDVVAEQGSLRTVPAQLTNGVNPLSLMPKVVCCSSAATASW
jgi:hypothetical protein